MLTKFSLLKRRPDLTQQQFSDHWHTTHAKVLAEQGNHQKYNRRYVQNHFIHGTALKFASTLFDGAAQMNPHSADVLNSTFQQDPLYMQFVRPDENRFLDVPNCAVIYCESRDFHDGPTSGDYKLLGLLKRAPNLTRKEFLTYWRERNAALVRTVPEFWDRVRGYSQHYVIPEASKGMAAGEEDSQASGFDGIAELRFDSLADLVAAFTAPRYLEIIRPDENSFIGRGSASFVAREEFIYDLG